MRHLIISLVIVAIAQSLAYLQLQSQFFWTWAKDHPLMMSLFGLPISILLIYFTKYCAIAFDGQVWPGRLIGFAVGYMAEDKTLSTQEQQAGARPRTYARHTQRGDFSSALLVLSAAVMKADGKLMKSELQYIRDFFDKQFGPASAAEQIGILKELSGNDTFYARGLFQNGAEIEPMFKLVVICNDPPRGN